MQALRSLGKLWFTEFGTLDLEGVHEPNHPLFAATDCIVACCLHTPGKQCTHKHTSYKHESSCRSDRDSHPNPDRDIYSVSNSDSAASLLQDHAAW